MQPANRMVLRLHCFDRSQPWYWGEMKRKESGGGGVAVDGGGFSELGRRFERITFSELGARVEVSK